MKNILINFIYPSHENLPEINQYISFFEKNNIICIRNSHSTLEQVNIDLYIEWHIMGTHFFWKKRTHFYKSQKQFLIHEYASLSTGRNKLVAKLKNFVKKILSHRADYYLFLNKNVHQDMGLCTRTDNYEYRDMGVSAEFIKDKSNKIIYDYIYVGSLAKTRKVDLLLNNNTMKNNKILIVGSYDENIELFNKYKNNVNIKFTGKVSQKKVINYIAVTKKCINYIPNKYPYNIQTSTKLLEYLAMGKEILSSNYTWVRNFLDDNNIEYTMYNEFLRIKPISDRSIIKTWDGIFSCSKIINSIINE